MGGLVHFKNSDFVSSHLCRHCEKCLDDKTGVQTLKVLNLNEYVCKNLEHFIDSLKSKGLILEVDLEYPHQLHDLHNDYPLAPEKKN